MKLKLLLLISTMLGLLSVMIMPSMAQSNDPTPTPQIVSTPIEDEATHVQFEYVRFSYDPELASDVEATLYAEKIGEPDYPIASIYPEYVSLKFVVSIGEDDYRNAYLHVYPIAEYEEIAGDRVTEAVEELQTLLEERPELVSEEKLPYFPHPNSAQIFFAGGEYLEFEGGSGIRYVTVFVQDASWALTNSSLLYTFQGITDDGNYYISARFPIDAGDVLPEPLDIDAFDLSEQGEEWGEALVNYHLEFTAALNDLEVDGYTPDLSLLDEMVMSIEIESED